jgi:hypothetical protein
VGGRMQPSAHAQSASRAARGAGSGGGSGVRAWGCVGAVSVRRKTLYLWPLCTWLRELLCMLHSHFPKVMGRLVLSHHTSHEREISPVLTSSVVHLSLVPDNS